MLVGLPYKRGNRKNCASDNKHVGEVEYASSNASDADVEKIDNAVEADAINQITQAASNTQTNCDGMQQPCPLGEKGEKQEPRKQRRDTPTEQTTP
jgi:hypothetical protein